MTKNLVSPAGTVVTVEGDLVSKLIRMGWSEPGKPEPKQEPVKRKPGRPRKSDSAD